MIFHIWHKVVFRISDWPKRYSNVDCGMASSVTFC